MEQQTLALEAVFVDREKEIGTLRQLYSQMVSGRGSTVFVVGEAGIGKTRLIRELTQYVESRGSILAAGSSYEVEGIMPYSPWIDVLRTLLRRVPSNYVQSMAPWILAEVGRLVPDILFESKEMGLKGWLQGRSIASTIAPSTDQERIRLFQAVTEFLSNVAKERGAVIFLDDIGWADQASLQLFHYVARRVQEEKLMLIGAYREMELPDDHPLAKLTLDLNRQRTAHQLSLNRLSHEHVSQLLAKHLHGPVTEEFSRFIYSRSGGNPFFIEEIARSLIEQNLLHESDRGLTLSDFERVEIPTTLKALIKQRMARLGDECIQFLSIAAVMGMEFDFEVLKKAAGLSENESIRLLETALRAQLIREKERGEKVLYVFADETIQEYLASQPSLLRRRKHHLIVGQCMEDLYKEDIEDHLGELAYHFVEAGEVSKAKEYSIKAGERSTQLDAHSEALSHYMNALELLGEKESEKRLDLLMRLSYSSWFRSDLKTTLRFTGEAIELAERLGLKTKTAEIYGIVGLAHWFIGNSKKDALESLMAGLKVLEDLEDTAEEALLSQQLARVYVLTGEPEPGLIWVRRAIEIASKLHLQEVLAHAHQTLAIALPLKEKESILSNLEAALKLALENNLTDPATRGYNNLASTTATMKADYTRAIELFQKGINYSRKYGYLGYQAWLQMELTLGAYLPKGEWEKCEKTALETIKIGKELGELYLVYPYTALAFIAAARGDLQKAKELLSSSLPVALKSEWPQFAVPAYRVAAMIHLSEDDLDKAEEVLRAAFEYRTRTSGSQRSYFIEVAFQLLGVNLRMGRFDGASGYHKELLQIASELDEPWGWAFERWAKGLLAEAQGRLDEAEKWLRECVELWKTLERPYDLGGAHLDLARVLRKGGTEGEAQENFDAAMKIYTQLGIPAAAVH